MTRTIAKPISCVPKRHSQCKTVRRGGDELAYADAPHNLSSFSINIYVLVAMGSLLLLRYVLFCFVSFHFFSKVGSRYDDFMAQREDFPQYTSPTPVAMNIKP